MLNSCFSFRWRDNRINFNLLLFFDALLSILLALFIFQFFLGLFGFVHWFLVHDRKSLNLFSNRFVMESILFDLIWWIFFFRLLIYRLFFSFLYILLTLRYFNKLFISYLKLFIAVRLFLLLSIFSMWKWQIWSKLYFFKCFFIWFLAKITAKSCSSLGCISRLQMWVPFSIVFL